MSPLILVAEDRQEVLGIAPLMIVARKVGFATLSALEFLGSPDRDYADFLYRDVAVLDTLWSAVRRESEGVDTIYLQQIKDCSPTCQYLRARAAAHLRPCTVGMIGRMPGAGDTDLRVFLKEHGLRKRNLARIERCGPVSLDLHTTAASIQASLPIFFEQHVSRWAGTDTPSKFNEDVYRRLYYGMAEWCEPSAVLGILRANGNAVASLFGFVSRETLIIYTLAYDVAYRQYGCGSVCILQVMQALAGRGVKWVDFSRGLESFKTQFADTPTMSVEFVEPRSVKGRFWIGAFLRSKDFALAHQSVRRIARRFGFRAEGVSPQTGGARAHAEAVEAPPVCERDDR